MNHKVKSTFYRPRTATLIVTLTAVLAVASMAIFSLLQAPYIDTDIGNHIKIAVTLAKLHSFPGPAFYYWFLSTITFGSDNLALLSNVVTVLLACSVCAKFLSTLSLDEALRSDSYGPLTIFLLCFAHSFPVTFHGQLRTYLGQVPPNVWHNSTLIFLMPFALLLYRSALSYLAQPTRRSLLFMLALSAINISIKPSFFFVFAPIFFLLAVQRFRFSLPAFGSLLLGIVGGLLVLRYHWELQTSNTPFRGVTDGIHIAPFYVWQHHSSNIWLSFLASFAFPLVFLMLFPQRAKSSLQFRFSGYMTVLGSLLFVLLSESGRTELHGNFAWQLFATNYLLFVAALTELSKLRLERQHRNWRWQLCALLFFMHVVSGGFYLSWVYWTRSIY